MRLTLRTMLAYMDEILEPEDHQDIGRKIEESEFANSLVHRIRDVSRRMRLAAPKVAGRGMGLDPNTVAEYLDNTLPGERVPDFEKVCLESDIHLAEVASCHQILTLVLGEAAEVDPQLRNRMYEIAVRADEPASRGATGPAAAAIAQAGTDAVAQRGEPVQPVRSRPEVPDYLRSGSRSKFWPIAIVTVLALCLVGVIIKASRIDVLKLVGIGDKDARDVANDTPVKPPRPDQVEPTATSGTNDRVGDRGVAGQSVGDRGVGDPSSEHPTSPDKASPHTDAQPPAPVETTGAEQPAKLPAADADAAKGATAPGKSNVSQPPPELPAAPPLIARPNDAPAETPTVPAATVPVATVPAAAADVGPSARAASPFIGRLASEQEVVLRSVAGNAEWHRAPPGATFNSGDKLLVLPTFRPMVTLATGITLHLVPETLIEFEGIDEGVPVVRVHYGRMVVMPSKADVKIKLAMGDSVGTVNFDDAESTIGVEVRPYHLPGTDPEKNQPRRAIALYGINGEVSWHPVGRDAVAEKLRAPARLALAADPVQPTSDSEMPKWIGAEPASSFDARASAKQALYESLDEKRAVLQALLELSGHQRVENKSLAARSLALIDEFEPFDGLLNNTDERSLWAIQIKSLQDALARGPAVAAKVREAFEKQRGKDGTELYRMLWGYSKDDLAGGAAIKLVEYLDHDNLDFRVLSFHNLRMITSPIFNSRPDGPTYNYQPQQTAANRLQGVRRWRGELKDGLIGPKTAPAARSPAGEPAASKGVPPPPTADGSLDR